MGKGEVNSGRSNTNEATNYLGKSTSEASKMLEAALLQMDGILSGAENKSEWKDPIKDMTKSLITAIQNSPTLPPPPDARTVEILVQWLQPERLRKLENERSALHMEISILSEQVEAQSGKIIELENALQEKKNCLRNMEESLQKEVLCRSALETQKLELLSSLSEMKLRQASLEHENLSLRSAGSLNNSERFSRHAGHYSSLPRPPTSTKKGVAFGKTPNMSAVQTTNILAVKGISSGCLSAPLLGSIRIFLLLKHEFASTCSS